MILSKIMHRLYLKIYISIVTSGTKTHVGIYTLKGNKIQDSRQKVFEGEELSSMMLSFIRSFTSESPFYYISLLDYSKDQGAIPTCKVDDFLKSKGKDTFTSLCYDSWSSYTSTADLHKLEKKYTSLGLDFVFSPFSVLEHFFKDKIEMPATLYILIQDVSISIAVFEYSKLKYAEYADIKNGKLENELLIGDEKGELNFDNNQLQVDLENIDVDEDYTDLDDFSNIQDLDSMDEFDDFQEIKVEDTHGDQEILKVKDEDFSVGFNEEYKRFSAIKNALKIYYTDEKYENNFIESVYIAATCDVGNSLKNYLEEELFLKVYMRQVDIPSEVFDLAKREKI